MEVSLHRTDAAVSIVHETGELGWFGVYGAPLWAHTQLSQRYSSCSAAQHFHTLLKAQDFREPWWLITPESNRSWHVLQRKGSFQTEMKRLHGEEKHILQC